MVITFSKKQIASQFTQAYEISEIFARLTLEEVNEIALYTVQKINNYPKSCGKTVENYFSLLFPDEIKSYLVERAINEKSFGRIAMGGYGLCQH